MKPAVRQLLLSGGSRATPLSGADGAVATFQMDLSRRMYYSGGRYYSSLSAMLAGEGGVQAPGTLTFGPFIDPSGVDQLGGAGDGTSTTGWVTGNGGTLASVGGEFELTAAGNLSYFSYAKSGLSRRAFRYRSTGRRGTTTNSLLPIASITNASFGSGNTATTISSTAPSTADTYIGVGSTDVYVGARNTSAVGTGTGIFDNLTVVEAWPFRGFPNGGAGFTVVVEFDAPPSAPAADQVIWQCDDGTERSRVRIVHKTDNTISVVMTNNNSAIVGLTMPTVINGSLGNKIAIGMEAANYGASLNGSDVSLTFSNAATSWCGASQMRIGRSFTGETYTGAVKAVAVLSGRQTTDWLEYITAPSSALWLEGDSYAAGANGVSLQSSLETATSKKTVTSALGGSTFAEVRDRIFARPWLRNYPLVIWDGSANSYSTVAEYLAILAQIVQWKGDGRFLFIPPLSLPPTTAGAAYTTDMYAIKDGAISAYGASKVFNAVPTLQALSTGDTNDNFDVIACNVIPRSTLFDAVHLTQVAMTAVANAAAAQALAI